MFWAEVSPQLIMTPNLWTPARTLKVAMLNTLRLTPLPHGGRRLLRFLDKFLQKVLLELFDILPILSKHVILFEIQSLTNTLSFETKPLKPPDCFEGLLWPSMSYIWYMRAVTLVPLKKLR